MDILNVRNKRLQTNPIVTNFKDLVESCIFDRLVRGQVRMDEICWLAFSSWSIVLMSAVSTDSFKTKGANVACYSKHYPCLDN